MAYATLVQCVGFQVERVRYRAPSSRMVARASSELDRDMQLIKNLSSLDGRSINDRIDIILCRKLRRRSLPSTLSSS